MTEKYFRHVDGGFYRWIADARSADDERDVVVYEHLWPFDRGVWVRDRAEFAARFSPIDANLYFAAIKKAREIAQAEVHAAKAARRAAKSA